MKYLLLFFALGLGYEGYTHWSELAAKYDEVHARVVSATAAAKAQTPSGSSASATQAAAVPAIPGSASLGVAPAAVTSASAPIVAQPPVAFNVRVAESQRQAVAKYPALGMVNSEMNSRFVFRYKRMVSEKSPRLQDPAWPMQLADECNDAIVASKPKPKTPSLDKPRQTNSLAAAGQTAAAH